MYSGEDLGRALTQALEKKPYRGVIKDLAAAIGVKPPSIYDIKDHGWISKEKLPEMWRFFSDVCGPEHWGLERFPWDDDGSKFVPLIDAKLSAGKGEIILSRDSSKSLYFRSEYLNYKGGRSGKFAVFPVSGDSMQDKHIVDGSYVLIDRNQNEPYSGCIYGIWIDDEIFIKELIKTEGGIS